MPAPAPPAAPSVGIYTPYTQNQYDFVMVFKVRISVFIYTILFKRAGKFGSVVYTQFNGERCVYCFELQTEIVEFMSQNSGLVGHNFLLFAIT